MVLLCKVRNCRIYSPDSKKKKINNKRGLTANKLCILFQTSMNAHLHRVRMEECAWKTDRTVLLATALLVTLAQGVKMVGYTVKLITAGTS